MMPSDNDIMRQIVKQVMQFVALRIEVFGSRPLCHLQVGLRHE
jgi:hypothetical protein